MCNILEPRGYRLKCRGKINVKGKGSMVTYFLRRKQFPADDEDALTHQSSRITQPSEDYDLCDLEDQQNMDLARLTEKRKSLCRQHHIFSSLTNKSVASEQSMADSIEFSDDAAIPSERVRLLHKSSSKSSSTAISPEIGGKIQVAKANIPAHCAPLKDSIESLEKMLKNDYSLSDINATKLHALPVGLQKLSTESGETLVSNGSIDVVAANAAGDGMAHERRPDIDRILEHDDDDDGGEDDLQLQLAPKAGDENLLKTLANKFRFRNDGIMKVSRSLYPFYRDQANDAATSTMTNSKSLHYFPTTHQQNGSSVFL